MAVKWQWNRVPEDLGSEETYRICADWVKDARYVDDWGCGKMRLKHFLPKTCEYTGIDYTPIRKDWTQIVGPVDLADWNHPSYAVEGIVIRHVLEHNHDWEKILRNAIKSFTWRMALCLFIPPSNGRTRNTRDDDFVPYLAINREKLMNILQPYLKRTEFVHNERVYLLEKKK